jgi:hypothetical protein
MKFDHPDNLYKKKNRFLRLFFRSSIFDCFFYIYMIGLFDEVNICMINNLERSINEIRFEWKRNNAPVFLENKLDTCYRFFMHQVF